MIKRGSKETAGFLRKRRAQLQLSFGMMFSIIIIIATVGVSIYFITKIINAQDCTKLQLLKDDLQNSIDKMWRSPFGQEDFKSSISSGITKVCIGIPPTIIGGTYAKVLEEIEVYVDEGENLFFYPPKNACKANFASAKLNHLKDSNFQCFDVVKGQVSFKIIKKDLDPLVTIQK